jgi:hypothetical protein
VNSNLFHFGLDKEFTPDKQKQFCAQLAASCHCIKNPYMTFSGKTDFGPNLFTLPYSCQEEVQSTALVNENINIKECILLWELSRFHR